MTATPLARRTPPAPVWLNPVSGVSHRLQAGDRITYKRRFLDPHSFTLRVWGRCERWLPYGGRYWLRGDMPWDQCLCDDVTAIERDGERLS